MKWNEKGVVEFDPRVGGECEAISVRRLASASSPSVHADFISFLAVCICDVSLIVIGLLGTFLTRRGWRSD